MSLELRRTGRFVLVAALASVALGAAALPPGTEQEIYERIKPVGTLNRPEPAEAGMEEAAEQVASEMRSGEQVYGTYCQACHAAGVAGAPKLGDGEAWEPRIAQGMETLYEHTYNGYNNVMPARGTCMDCSDAELRNAVDYMVGSVEG